ncbi:MAG: hypothetical protein EBZ44_07400 [Verrucomicrobia bacterium]|nr:hypothetical protein [Verrucomicrobiota bacterium]
MITTAQINSLSDEELGYLVICFANEWQNIRMPYEFKFNFIKSFRNDSIQHILNKYSSNLKDEHKNIVIDILNKLEENK